MGIRMAFPTGLANPRGGSTPKPYSWWPGGGEHAALGRTCVTCGVAASLVLMDHHCPLHLGASSSQPDCILTCPFFPVRHSRLTVE